MQFQIQGDFISKVLYKFSLVLYSKKVFKYQMTYEILFFIPDSHHCSLLYITFWFKCYSLSCCLCIASCFLSQAEVDRTNEAGAWWATPGSSALPATGLLDREPVLSFFRNTIWHRTPPWFPRRQHLENLIRNPFKAGVFPLHTKSVSVVTAEIWLEEGRKGQVARSLV